MQEKREFIRYNTAIDLTYTKIESYAIISSTAITENISLGGLCAALSRLTKKGDEFLVELSAHSKKKTTALAKVVWAKPIDNQTRNMCGLKITRLSPESEFSELVKAAV